MLTEIKQHMSTCGVNNSRGDVNSYPKFESLRLKET